MRLMTVAAVAACCAAAWTVEPAFALNTTQTTLSVSSTSGKVGDSVTLTASVTSGGSAVPNGNVQFSDNGVALGDLVAVSSGTASTSTTFTTAGSHVIKATYQFNFPYTSSNSDQSGTTATVTITGGTTKATTSIALSGSQNIQAGQSATLTATVTNDGTAGTPTGTVTFQDNGSDIGQATLNGSGVATHTATGFTAITHVITAKYLGDAGNASATSGSFSVTVTAPPAAVDTTVTAGISPNPIPTNGSATMTAHVQQVGKATTPPAGSVVSFFNAADDTLIAQGKLDANGNATVVHAGWLAGHYDIKAKYLGDANFNSASATFSVDVRAVATVTVTAPSPGLTYGDATPALTPSYSGFTNGDTASSLTSQATCTATGAATPPAAGTYTVSCSGATATYYTFTYVSGKMTVAKAPLTVTPNDATMEVGNAVPVLTASIRGFVGGETLFTSGVTGAPHCTTTATAASPVGTYPITCTVGTLSAHNYSFAVVGAGTLRVTKIGHTPVTVTDFTGGAIPVGAPVTLQGQVWSNGLPVYPAELTMTLGGLTCTAQTNYLGNASCEVTPTGPLGPTTTTVSFAGDAIHAPGSASLPAILFDWPGGGSFVVGDETASSSSSVTFWGSQWAKDNEVSDGKPSNSFKGFASSPTVPTLGATWTTGTGNSPPPPAGPLPGYMGVIVTDSAKQSGSTISGRIVNIVVVRPDAGYDANPGHSGTGTIVASYLDTDLPVPNGEQTSQSGSGGSGSEGSSHDDGVDSGDSNEGLGRTSHRKPGRHAHAE